MKIKTFQHQLDLIRKEREAGRPVTLSDEQQEEKTRCEQSLSFFVSTFWHVLEGSVPLVKGWHIELMCKELEGAARFEYNRYICNMPPRCSKTTLLTMFTPFVWTTQPSRRFMIISGSKKLALLDNMRCKMIIEDEKYKKYWGDKVSLLKESRGKEFFYNSQAGSRSAFGMGTNVRGHGANFLILDDPNTDGDLRSERLREVKNEFVASSVLNRFNDSTDSCLICVQQRLGLDDVSGFLLDKARENPNWRVRKIILPMIKE